MASRKIMGDRGSPYLTTLQCKTLFPGSSFNKIVDEAVHQREAMQFVQSWPKPRYDIILIR
jgi:hypothetical protein